MFFLFVCFLFLFLKIYFKIICLAAPGGSSGVWDLVSRPGMEQGPLVLEPGFATIGVTGKSLVCFSIYRQTRFLHLPIII